MRQSVYMMALHIDALFHGVSIVVLDQNSLVWLGAARSKRLAARMSTKLYG